MTEQAIHLNNPLHGLKLETLLDQLISYYGFDILAEYTRLNCFKNNPSKASSLKFLKKTEWAREKLERFYLYNYKSLPEPSDEEFDIPPRQRVIPLDIKPGEPKQLKRGEAVVPVTKASFKETHRKKSTSPKQKKAVSNTASANPYANSPK